MSETKAAFNGDQIVNPMKRVSKDVAKMRNKKEINQFNPENSPKKRPYRMEHRASAGP
jgi:hypothetical protein